MIIRKLFFTFLLALLVSMAAQAQEPYAVLSEDNSVLMFYYDDQKAARNGMDVGPFTYSWDDNRQRGIISSGWDEQRESITCVVFDNSFAKCTNITSTAFWFFGFDNLSSIACISNLKTDNVTNMSGMFDSCRGLTSLDVSNFKTDNVTDMTSMFSGCSGLTSLDVSGFKTDKVTYMGGLFQYCSGLRSLDVTGFKTDNVTDMSGMFAGCSGLRKLDVTGFKTDNVANMSYMFFGCSDLKTIYAGDGWSTAKVGDGKDIFNDCKRLVGGAGTRYHKNNIDYNYARIDGGTANPGYFTVKKGDTDK